MILYYSGTGNSRYAASLLSAQTGDELVCMNDIMRERILDPYVARYAFDSATPFVIVCPTYCWRVPRVVEQFLRNSRFTGDRRVYFFLTCGSGTGNAAGMAEELAKELELAFMGLSSVKMPENFITLFSAPSYDEAQGILRAAVSQVDSVARLIKNGRPIEDPNAGSAALTGFNRFFYRHFVHDRKFRVTDKCVGCGQCEDICPLANIHLADGRPTWNGNCTQCMACIGVCPTNAIEFGLRTQKKRRYYLFPGPRQKQP